MELISAQTDGGAAVSTDEFIINRAGADFKLTHANIVLGVTTLITAETNARIAADLTLTNGKLDRAGDTMTGFLTLSAAPTSSLHAVTKSYVDNIAGALLPISGGTLTGNLILNADPTVALGAATKQYVDAGVAGRWKNATVLDCSANPNYPTSTAGSTYRVTVAGKVGGVSGKTVGVDDMIYCHTTDAVGGTEASVGTSYIVLQGNLLAAAQGTSGHIAIATNALLDAGTDDTTAASPAGVRRVIDRLTSGHNRVTDAGTSITVPDSAQSTIYLLTSTSARGISLPTISNLSGSTKLILVIKDASSNAGTNNVTVTSTGGDLIDGAATFVLSTDGQAVTLISDGSTNWYSI
jgi:hypothetical protein